jgi:hypothetical protein
MRKLLLAGLALTLSVTAQPAAAAWHKASTKHFIIYADQKPDRLRDFAAKLERFDQAVRFARRMEDPPIGDGNRLTVYVVRNIQTVQKLAHSRDIGGFYVGRAVGPFAVVPKSSGPAFDVDYDEGQIIFFHEYAHHLMLQELDSPLPEWLIEGFAEFMSTASFDKDGSVWLGKAANHRAASLFYGDQLPIETLLAGNYGDLRPELRESVYSKGWLLTHYLNFDIKRRPQLGAYLRAIAEGKSGLEAARIAFGDLNKLENDLAAYVRQRKLSALRLAPRDLKPPAVEVTPLSPGASAVLALRIDSKMGVDDKTAEPLAVKVRKVQAQYPGDAFVEVTLAEAEIDAAHFAASEAAAGRALQRDPSNTEAMIFKARAILEGAVASKRTDPKLFAEGRDWLLKANKTDSEDPEPLMEYYKSYLLEGRVPTQNAVEALHYASKLAPQDMELRISSAMQYLLDKKLKEARVTLAPIAYNPHATDTAAVARKIMVRIDAGDVDGALKVVQAEPEEPASAKAKN